MKPRITTTFGALPIGAWFHIPHDQFTFTKTSETTFGNCYVEKCSWLDPKDTVELVEDAEQEGALERVRRGKQIIKEKVMEGKHVANHTNE